MTTAAPNAVVDSARIRRRKILAVIFVVGGIVGGLKWWQSRGFLTNDDAFIQSDITLIGLRVAGTVTAVRVQSDHLVKAGDVLFEMDAG